MPISPSPSRNHCTSDAGDGDRAFQGVHGGLVADPVADGRQQAVGRAHRLVAGVEEQEAARAVRALGLALGEAGLPEQRGLLVAQRGRDPHAGQNPPSPRRMISADGRISGSIWRGTPKIASSSSCQFRVLRFISRVRLAFVTSVTCMPPSGPPVRFQISQLSMVPNSTSPRSARSRRPGRVVQQPAHLRGGEVRRRRQAAELTHGLSPRRCGDSSSTSASVRVSCHTIARPTGRPVWRSHSTVVSRWLAMPSATTWSGVTPAWARASGAMRSRLCQISIGSCSTQPGLGKCCLCSRCVTATRRPPGRTGCTGSTSCPGPWPSRSAPPCCSPLLVPEGGRHQRETPRSRETARAALRT